jgi:hypothetical protein
VEEAIRYQLAVLTHGRMSTLDETLESFFENVSPRPADVRILGDGIFRSLESEWTVRHRDGYSLRGGPAQVGFCRATGQLWTWACDSDIPYVFWLEHDFLFLDRLDLHELAAVLDSDHTLAQMALMRDAVSEQEIAAGGLVESRPGEYEAMRGWLRHRSYLTTNPNLMRTEFMRSNPWPDDGLPECEGRFGLELVRQGYRFGVWGDGEPQVEHIGVRSGAGY